MIYFFQGGLKKHAPLIRVNLRIWLKIRQVSCGCLALSRFVKKSKKILKNLIFALAPLRI
jgi:hypothetical protein